MDYNTNNMFPNLKIACMKAGISVSEFARRIGKNRKSVFDVAHGRATSAYIKNEIERFIAASETGAAPVINLKTGDWLTTAQVAARTGMRKESVANKARAGKYKLCRFENGRYLIHVNELNTEGRV